MKIFKNNFWQKTTLIGLLIVFLASNFWWVKSAQAFVVVETNASVYLPIIAAATVGETEKTIEESILKIAFNALKKRIFDMMVDQIIDYINGQGKPQFVTDWKAFFQTAADTAVGDIVQQIGLGALCNSAFGLRIQLAMVAPPRFSKQISCTLTSIVRNIDNFFQDFRRGGWLAYQEMWAPNNNFYGTLLLAWNEKESEIAAPVASERDQALAGQGFLSVKKCSDATVVENGRTYLTKKCVTTTPGVAVGALAQKAVGADLDYIINSEDLAEYVAAISDALINRMVRASVEGLGGVSTPNVPRGPFVGTTCENFSGRARQSCLEYQTNYNSRRNSLTTRTRRVTAAEINQVLQPRQGAQTILRSLIEKEDAIIANLNALFNCQLGRGANANETRTLLTKHQENREDYIRSQYENDDIINELTAAKAFIENPENNTKTVTLGRTTTDQKAAEKFLTAQTNEQARKEPQLIDLNTSFQTRAAQCQSQTTTQ